MRTFLLVLLLLSSTGTAIAFGADASRRAEIARLFEVGWDVTAAARTAADRHYRELVGEGRADVRAKYAYVLVLLKQRRYDEASKMLDAVLAAEEENIPARENKVRLLLLAKKYDAALVELDRLSRLAAAAPVERLSPERRRDVLCLMGRAFGYLEGPAGNGATEDARRRVQRDVETRLADEELTIYDEARDGVLARFEAMADASARGRESALADKERQRSEARRDLEERQTEHQERRTQLLTRGEQLRNEIADNEAAFVKAEQPLRDRLAQLERQAAIPRRELTLLVLEADSLRALAARTQDPAERERLLFRAQQLDLLASRYDAELVVLERQAASVATERAQLQDRFRRENAVLAGSLKSIDQELEALQRGEKRNALDERRLARPLASGTRAVRALEAEASAFTTYESFPLEEERQRLLESLGNAP